MAPDIRSIATSLGRVANLWLDPEWRRDAEVALQVSTGFERNIIENALNAAFKELTEEKILAYLAQEPAFQKGRSFSERVLLIAAGNVFTAWLPSAVTLLLLGSRCDIKPSSQEPTFASLWKRSLEQVDPLLAENVQCVRASDALLMSYPAIVAYGSDATLKTLRSKARPDVKFIGYGHKFSVMVIAREALVEPDFSHVLNRIENDVVPFNLAGCLSPQFLYLEGEDPGILERLFITANGLPQMRSFESWEELKAELQAHVPQLSTLGFAGPTKRLEAIQSEWADLGLSRICGVGEMQQPPLGWRNGGISLAEELTR